MFHGYGVKTRPFIVLFTKQNSQFWAKIKKATVVPKEAPMLAMKALELRKK